VQKNIKTYLLLGIVLLIWGLIGYKIFNWMPDNEEALVVPSKVDFKPKQIKERDTFSIVAKYRDPFLESAPEKVIVPKKKLSTQPKAEEPTIDIRYTGFITDGSSNQKIFFVTINGQQKMMKLNDKVDDVSLISGSKETIKVRYQNKRITLALEK
tara:strand:- start:3434 stop:3898 length:465 start_codon:yes stop_codon:yes gene_type:complete